MFRNKKNTSLEMNRKLKKVGALFICILIVLTWRLDCVRKNPKSKPELQASMSSNHIQKENTSNYNYLLLDRNDNNIFSSVTKYKLVIDTSVFIRLNSFNQHSLELLIFNSIMKNVDSNFSFENINKQRGSKLYYNITENIYEKIKSNLSELRGIYVYPYEEKSNQEYWRIENIIQSTTFFKNEKETTKSQDSLEIKIKNDVNNNEKTKWVFEKDVNGKYNDPYLQLNKNNLNVKLTIDNKFQSIIREILNDEKYTQLNNAGVVLIEGETGKILALAQKDETKGNLILGSGIDGYEPGSVFKILTLEAAMKYHGVELNDKFTCSGIVCKKDKIHGKISIRDAFKVSCNDVFAILGKLVTKDQLISFAKEQGIFNRILGLDKSMESIGKYDDSDNSIVNLSIGQSMQTNLLQMTGIISTIVNRGKYIKPYIIDSYVNQDGEKIFINTCEDKQVVSEYIADSLKMIMNETVASGTAMVTRINGLEVGAKTGTAEIYINSNGKIIKDFHGWFIGYFNYNGKYYLLGVCVPNIGDKNSSGENAVGGNTAGPIFRETILKITNKN